jgi:uncharacterized protein involved in exopolysaccharide biosynthesis/Mrp family chromosome partitioning ATPase
MNPSAPVQEMTESMPIETEKKSSVRSNSEGSGATRSGVGRVVRRRRPLELSLNALLQLPFVYLRLIATCVVVAGLLTWAALLVWPRTYQSEAKILILVGRESVSLDPTVTTSQTLLLQKTQEEEINSALDILTSRSVADKVVEKIGAAAILDGYLPSTGGAEPSAVEVLFDKAKAVARGAVDKVLLTSGLRDPLSDHELAVMKVQGALEIEAPKKSTTITIHAESKSPGMAQAIAQTVMDTFMEQHLVVTKTKGSKQFFTTQKDEAEKSLHDLLTKKSKFMTERKIVSVDANRTMLKDQLGAIDRDLVIAIGELTQTRAEIEGLIKGKNGLDSEIVASKLEASDNTWSGMRQRVYELELLEQSQTAIYTDAHPTLMKTREQLEGARTILAKLDSDRMDESTTPNPVVLQMEEQLQLRLAKLEGLKSIIEEKKSQKLEVESQIRELLEVEVDLTRMDNEIAVSTSKLRQLSEKENEASVIDELQAERITNVSIFQPASFVERAMKPNKPLLAAAGIMMGLFGGIGLAFLKEISAKTIRSVEQAEEVLKVEVVGAVAKRSTDPIKIDGRVMMESDLRRTCGAVLTKATSAQDLKEKNEAKCIIIGVLAVNRGAGGSTVALSLAATAAYDFGLKTILVDANEHNNGLSARWAKKQVSGLAELVQGEATISDCIHGLGESEVLFLANGCESRKSQARSGWKAKYSALMQLENVAEVVIVDLSTAEALSQAVVLAGKLDGVVLVVESGKTDSQQATDVLNGLMNGQANVYGVLVNKVKNAVPSWLANLLGIHI